MFFVPPLSPSPPYIFPKLGEEKTHSIGFSPSHLPLTDVESETKKASLLSSLGMFFAFTGLNSGLLEPQLTREGG